MSFIRNIVFDFNGVIADINKHDVCFNNVDIKDFYNALRFGCSYLTKRGFKKEVKSAYESLLSGEMSTTDICNFVELHLPGSGITFDKLFANISNSIVIRPKMMELAQLLRANGYKIFILSNTIPQTADKINSKEIKSYFDGVYCTSEKGKFKPNVDVYLDACKEWNILPEESLFIDDRGKNLEGAENAGFQKTLLASKKEEETYYQTFNEILH